MAWSAGRAGARNARNPPARPKPGNGMPAKGTSSAAMPSTEAHVPGRSRTPVNGSVKVPVLASVSGPVNRNDPSAKTSRSTDGCGNASGSCPLRRQTWLTRSARSAGGAKSLVTPVSEP